MSGYSLGTQICYVEDLVNRRAASTDKTVRYENDVLKSVATTLLWLKRNEDDLRVAMRRIKAERAAMAPDAGATDAGASETEPRMLEKMATVVTFADDMKREMRDRGVRQLTRVCPDHPSSLIRASLIAGNDALRMVCTDAGCSYRVME